MLFGRNVENNIVINDEIIYEFIGSNLGILDYYSKISEISEDVKKEIVRVLNELLMKIGIDTNKICILDSYDYYTKTINCYLLHGNTKFELSIYDGRISIDFNNGSREYRYYNDRNKGTELALINQTFTIGDKVYREEFHDYNRNIDLRYEDYTLSIEISIPSYTKGYDDNSRENAYEINSTALRNYLLSLTYPIDVKETYKNINEILNDSIKNYSDFKISVYKRVINKDVLIDGIYLTNGDIKSYTRSGKTISFGENDNWTYDNENLYISQKDGIVDFSIKSVSPEILSKCNPPFVIYTAVCKEIQDVRDTLNSMQRK